MLIRLQRIIASVVVPFLSVCSLVGVGYSLWAFAESNQPIIDNTYFEGNLKVEGIATTPLNLEILTPPGYDGYRIVYDQGGLGSRFDEEVGVRLSTSVVYCTLTTSRALVRDDLSGISVIVSLASKTGLTSCPCLEKIQFKTRDASTYLRRSATLLALAGDSWISQPQISNQGNSYYYDITIPVELEWRNGMKPTDDESWQNFMSSIDNCGEEHILTISLDNGIL